MTKRKEEHNDTSDDGDFDLLKESSPSVYPEDTDSVSSDTSNNDASVKDVGESHPDAADQSSGDVPGSNPPSPAETSKVGPSVTDSPVNSSERRVDFAEGTNFTPPNQSVSKAAKTASKIAPKIARSEKLSIMSERSPYLMLTFPRTLSR